MRGNDRRDRGDLGRDVLRSSQRGFGVPMLRKRIEKTASASGEVRTMRSKDLASACAAERVKL